MATEPRDGVRHIAGVALATMFLMGLPVLYVLSIGPAEAMYESCGESMQYVLEVVYAPLTWLDANSDIARSFFDWYRSLWC